MCTLCYRYTILQLITFHEPWILLSRHTFRFLNANSACVTAVHSSTTYPITLQFLHVTPNTNIIIHWKFYENPNSSFENIKGGGLLFLRCLHEKPNFLHVAPYFEMSFSTHLLFQTQNSCQPKQIKMWITYNIQSLKSQRQYYMFLLQASIAITVTCENYLICLLLSPRLFFWSV